MSEQEVTYRIPDTESRILQAAEREFIAKGFAGARTTSIAESAGVTHAMLHYYFRTKEKLFERIIAEKMGKVKTLLMQSVGESDLPFDEMIANIICRHLDFISDNPELPRFMVGEVFWDPERLKLLMQILQSDAPQMVSRLQSQLDKARAEGRCRKVDAKMLIIDIFSLNLFSYLAAPLINAMLDDCMADSDAFLEQRKMENVDTILRKLRI